MKIVIAPDSFKENLTSLEVASEIETGLKRVWPDAVYVKVPMADGGEGTVQSLVDATGGQIVETEVSGPMGICNLGSYRERTSRRTGTSRRRTACPQTVASERLPAATRCENLRVAWRRHDPASAG